jgi:hypothetical protein
MVILGSASARARRDRRAIGGAPRRSARGAAASTRLGAAQYRNAG